MSKMFSRMRATIMLLSEENKKRVKGIVINKFRGNPEVLKTGFEIIEKLTGVPTLGIIPYEFIDLEDEDSISERSKNINLLENKSSTQEYREEQFEKLERIVRKNIHIDKIYKIIGLK